jgi:hypothetical protein
VNCGELKGSKVLLTEVMGYDSMSGGRLFGVRMGWSNGGSLNVVQPFYPVFQQLAPGSMAPEDPAFTMSLETMQALMDAMWEKGVRPSAWDGRIANVAIAAKDEHIGDLRRMLDRFLPPAKTPDTPSTPSEKQTW